MFSPFPPGLERLPDVHAVNDQVWSEVLCALKPSLDKEHFETWLAPVTFHSFENDTLKLNVPSEFYRKWLLSNYYEQIISAVEVHTNRRPEIQFLIAGFEDTEDPANQTPVPYEPSLKHAGGNGNGSNGIDFAASKLNPRYVFDRFVVGESNRFAHAAARAVSDPASRAYNPLFIYGGVGLGKTHLMQAVGHELLAVRPNALVLYVTSEQFMNAFIDSIAKKRQYDFRNYYRNVDLLLLDDVQFFMGKEHTQTQFFHTFNAIYEAGKKIVISSDRPPKELATLEERLRSRFEWGLIVDIQPPDLETRIAILRRKAESENITIPDDALVYIAERVNTNIRSLEGALVRIHAYITLHKKKKITVPLIREIIGDLLDAGMQQAVSIATVQAAVCEYFDIKLADLIGHGRIRRFAVPRHIAQHLCRKLTNKSLPEIGVHFGGRDHASIHHACRKIEETLEKDRNLETIISYLTRNIKERS